MVSLIQYAVIYLRRCPTVYCIGVLYNINYTIYVYEHVMCNVYKWAARVSSGHVFTRSSKYIPVYYYSDIMPLCKLGTDYVFTVFPGKCDSFFRRTGHNIIAHILYFVLSRTHTPTHTHTLRIIYTNKIYKYILLLVLLLSSRLSLVPRVVILSQTRQQWSCVFILFTVFFFFASRTEKNITLHSYARSSAKVITRQRL